jgi:phage-related protein
MTSEHTRLPVLFYRTRAGNEPVREWLKELPPIERARIGADLYRVQSEWPVGMPLCRSLGGGLREIRSSLLSNRIARIMFFIEDDEIYVVHGFIKKTRKTPPEEIELARRRFKETRT